MDIHIHIPLPPSPHCPHNPIPSQKLTPQQRHGAIRDETHQPQADQPHENPVRTEEQPRVPDEVADAFVGGDHFRADDGHEGGAHGEADAREHVRHGRRDDDVQDDLPLGGAHTAGGADFVLLHGEHAGQGIQHDDEESGVQDEHDFRCLSDAEPDEKQRDKRDRRNEADEVQKRLRESADGIDFADDEADRNRDQAAKGPAEQDAV